VEIGLSTTQSYRGERHYLATSSFAAKPRCVTTDTLSYRQEADSGLERIFADVPGILQWGDTAQIAALVAPRPLAVLMAGLPASMAAQGASDFMAMPRFEVSRDTVSESALRASYEWSVKFYRLLGAGSRMRAGLGGRDLAQTVCEWLNENY